MGESLFQRWTAGTGMVFCGQYPRKGLHILRRECAWHTNISNLLRTTLHAQNVKIWSYCTSCVVTAWKRLLERLLLWGRKNKENTTNESWLVLVYLLSLFIRSLPCGSGCYCTNRRWSLSATIYCQHKILIGSISCPHFIQHGGNCSASHTLRSVDWLVDSCGSCGLSFLTQPVCAGLHGSSLIGQTLSFHSTDRFQYQLHGHILKAIGAVERKSKG